MLKVGGQYFCRVKDYVLTSTIWKVESYNPETFLYTARSYDSFEIEVYVNMEGRHVGSRELGMYETPVNVFMVEAWR